MTTNHYVIDAEGKPLVVNDLLVWAQWMESGGRVVAKDTVDDVEVSTVFLGLDLGFGGALILWETMIFGGSHDGYCNRYSSREEAITGHEGALTMVLKPIKKSHVPRNDLPCWKHS